MGFFIYPVSITVYANCIDSIGANLVWLFFSMCYHLIICYDQSKDHGKHTTCRSTATQHVAWAISMTCWVFLLLSKQYLWSVHLPHPRPPNMICSKDSEHGQKAQDLPDMPRAPIISRNSRSERKMDRAFFLKMIFLLIMARHYFRSAMPDLFFHANSVFFSQVSK